MAENSALVLFLEGLDGSGMAVSGPATGRLRYNDVTARWEASVQGGAYGPLGGGTPASVQTTLLNQSGVGIIAGAAVAPDTSGTIAAADKASATRRRCIGLAGAAIPDTASGSIVTDGALTLTAAEWDAVTGGVGGLVPGRFYYVGAAGLLTGSSTSTPGEWIVAVGIALSTTTMLVQIQPGILLS